MKKIIKWVVIVIIALIILAIVFGGDDKADTSTDTSASSQEKVVEVMPVTATELFDAYQSNEVAADQKYKGKKLEVTGKVTGIDSGISDQAIVQLATSNEFMSVSAQGGDDFTKTAAALSKGQDVTLVCEGDGEVAGFVQLSDCTVK